MPVLNEYQRKCAQRFRDLRPAVIPGTNVIAYGYLRDRYYDDVTRAMESLGIDNDRQAVNEFCDICGIPD